MENKRTLLNITDNPIYKDFFFKNDFVVNELEKYPTKWRRGEESKNSFSLSNKDTYEKTDISDVKKYISDLLQKTFGIENKELFGRKYEEAISGDGKEWKRITTLHSSSLIALLCFYSVSEEHPLSIGDYVFKESFFEVKTVVHDGHKSNMDVVLRGINKKTGKKVVLFLESKFTEYLNCGKKGDISKAYNDEYKKLSLFDNPIESISFGNDGEFIYIKSNKPRKFPIYCGGIKQMLSHYIGVRNYAIQKNVGHQKSKFVDNEEILLGEIMFDFNGAITNSSEKLDNYKKVYTELAKRINNHQTQIRMLNEVMTYQDIFSGDFIKEKKVKQFYNLVSVLPKLNEPNKA